MSFYSLLGAVNGGNLLFSNPSWVGQLYLDLCGVALNLRDFSPCIIKTKVTGGFWFCGDLRII